MKEDEDVQKVVPKADREPAREGWRWLVIFEPSVLWGCLALFGGTCMIAIGLWGVAEIRGVRIALDRLRVAVEVREANDARTDDAAERDGHPGGR